MHLPKCVGNIGQHLTSKKGENVKNIGDKALIIGVTDFQLYLNKTRACEEACQWAGERTAQQAWDECDRADWLLWWAAHAKIARKTFVRIACACARTALPYVQFDELRPLKAIETAEAWCDGKATIEEVRAAAYAAHAAAHGGAAAAAYDAAHGGAAAYAAAYAAAAAYGAAYDAAAAVIDAAAYGAAYDAAAAVADADAESKVHLKMCAIVRAAVKFEDLGYDAMA
jgi:hypothetical protein